MTRKDYVKFAEIIRVLRTNIETSGIETPQDALAVVQRAMAEMTKKYVRSNVLPVWGNDVEENEFPSDANRWAVTLKYGGRRLTVPFFTGAMLPGEPKTEDVLGCLLRDAGGYEAAGSFGEWAEEYGYDTDSRRAERVYRQVERFTKGLKRLLGKDYDVLLDVEEKDLGRYCR